MTEWLIDKSALVRLSRSTTPEEWVARISRGLVRVSTVTILEVGFSAVTAADIRQVTRQPQISLMPLEYMTPAIEQRAVEVQALLGDRGLHRAVGVADLLIAAIAERAGLTVLHVDKDFDLIASVTQQRVERLALR